MAGKTAFTLEVPVSAATVKALIRETEEWLDEAHDLKIKLKDNPDVMAMIEKGMKKSLGFAVEDLYFDQVVDTNALAKLFKNEIKDANDKYEARMQAEYEAEEAKRVKTAGVLRMHPDQLAEAKKLLKAAGIDATT